MIVKEIRKQIEQFQMLDKGDRILIGLSGGADSVCLTQILYELAPEYDLNLAAVCCHHGLRGEAADEDVRFAKDFCKERGIHFISVEENVEDRAKAKHMTFEEAGREFRYEIFQKIMEQDGYHKLAIAHNADDRAETMLFHLTRGTGIAGLCTMEPVRSFGLEKKIIRPLLWTQKCQIEDWLSDKGISWRVDETNQEDSYSRNRIRHHVLPELERINERAALHMGQTAGQLHEICSYLKEEEEKTFSRIVREEQGRLLIESSSFSECHIYMKKSILYRCLAQMAEGKKDITSTHVKILLDLLEGQTGKEASLIRGIQARKEYGFLVLSKEFQTFQDDLEEKQKEILQKIELVMEKKPYEGQEISKNEYTKHFDCAKILNELCIRFWQPGDYLYLKEDGGRKKLNRYFIDAKIPAEKRGQIPLLAEGSHVLWIVGHRISAYYKVTDETKEILSVTIKNKG